MRILDHPAGRVFRSVSTIYPALTRRAQNGVREASTTRLDSTRLTRALAWVSETHTDTHTFCGAGEPHSTQRRQIFLRRMARARSSSADGWTESFARLSCRAVPCREKGLPCRGSVRALRVLVLSSGQKIVRLVDLPD